MYNSIYFTQNGHTYSMPDYFTHYILAEKIYERLPKLERAKIKNHSLYLLGAQGGDVFFTYNLTPTNTNLGKQLHFAVPSALFEKLLKGDFSYVAGFATHYAVDSTFHPIVYAYENSKRTPTAHNDFESDFGLYISRHFGITRKILPAERVLGATFVVYDSIKRCLPQVTVTGVERCLKRHFWYTRVLYQTKRNEFKLDFDFNSLNGKIEEAIELGVSIICGIYGGQIDERLLKNSFLQR